MKLITTSEVAILLGYTPRYILYLIKDKKITPTLKLANGNYLFNENDILLFKNNKKF